MNSNPWIEGLARKACDAHMAWLRLAEDRDGSPEMAQAIADAHDRYRDAVDDYWDAMEAAYPETPIEELPTHWEFVD